jgi:predicted esterase
MALLFFSLPAAGQFDTRRYALTGEERTTLETGLSVLRSRLEALKLPKTDDRRADVEIYLDAVERNLQQGLFFDKRNYQNALACLQEGQNRASELAAGRASWRRQSGVVVLGYRSGVDGTAQPFQVYVPAEYDFASPRPMPLHLFLHGRSANLNEISFLSGKGWVRSSFGTDALPFVALYPYGRGNNGWRWAGERDVFEAVAAVRRFLKVDNDRIVLRGFSMGGHGTWHIGLQHPGEWAAISPGAGFTETRVYQKLGDGMPEWYTRLWRFYDPLGYAANAHTVPLHHYCGEEDPALVQHRLMTDALMREKAAYHEYIGPKTGHRYDPAKLEELLRGLAPAVRRADPDRVQFTTYTLRFADCRWVKLMGLERHLERADIDAQLLNSAHLRVHTRNVTAVTLTPPNAARRMRIEIDGQTLSLQRTDQGLPIHLMRQKGKWQPGMPKGLRKQPGLQGPIDDALFGPLLAVTPSGVPWHAEMDRWTARELDRFRAQWSFYMRGTLPVVRDTDLSAEQVRGHNLYVFGDPGSSAVLRRLLSKLPLKWDREGFELGGRRYSGRDHLPMLIFPNPENPKRYIVLNSGFTFSTDDMVGSNARQHPHLPDWAVVKFDPDHFSDDRLQDTVAAGSFSEQWR